MVPLFVQEAERQLQNDETCFDLSTFETPYSYDDRSIAYSGIMFDLFTKGEALEILTLEVDVRLAEVTDFNVEVYRTDGNFLTKINDPTQWTLVAQAEALPSPDGSGIIIPQRAFENFQVGARERVSFYIQMQGSWIENKAEALVKTSELAYEGADFMSFAGIGTSSLFPDEPEPTTDPQFAGKVYYQQPKACQDSSRTEVELQFVVGAAYGHQMLNILSSSVETVAQQRLMSETWFSEQASAADLTILANTRTSTAPYNGGNCPWSSCSTFTTKLAFEHSSDLSPGDVRFHVYRYADAIMRDVRSEMQNKEIAYLGLKSATSGFSFTLTGVPDGEAPMTSDQEDYLTNSMVNFFQTTVRRNTGYVDVFESHIGSPEYTRNRQLRIRRELNGAITVEGTMYGGRSAPLDKEEFNVQLQRAMREESDTLVNSIKYGSVIPQSNLPPEEALEYFDDLASISGDLVDQGTTDTDWGGTPFDHSTYENPIMPIASGDTGEYREDAVDKISGLGEDASGNPIFVIVAAVIGGLLIVGGVTYFVYERYKKKKYKENLELYRKKAAAERKIKRLSKDDSCDKLRKDALKALDELAEEKGTRTSSSKSLSDDAPPESSRPSSFCDLDKKLEEHRGRKKSRSKRDAESLPDAESLRRASRSRSKELPSGKPTLLASFMEAENSKKKPGDRLSGTRSLDGGELRRSFPARALSDRPKSQNSGNGPDRKITRAKSSDDLEDIRAALNRRNTSHSPRSDRHSVDSDLRQSRSTHARSIDIEGSISKIPSRGGIGRSKSGDIGSSSAHARGLTRTNSSEGSRSAHTRSIDFTRSNSADFGSRSAHARTISIDSGTGLYGSSTPRRRTRPQTPVGANERPRSQSPSRRAPSRSQSFDNKSRGGQDPMRGSVRGTRSGDLSAMRQSPSQDPMRGSVRGTRSGDLSAMRRSPSHDPMRGSVRATRSADLSSMRQSRTTGQDSDHVRRGRKRDGKPPMQGNGSSHARGVPHGSMSNDGLPRTGAPDRASPRRTKSGGF